MIDNTSVIEALKAQKALTIDFQLYMFDVGCKLDQKINWNKNLIQDVEIGERFFFFVSVSVERHNIEHSHFL